MPGTLTFTQDENQTHWSVPLFIVNHFWAQPWPTDHLLGATYLGANRWPCCGDSTVTYFFFSFCIPSVKSAGQQPTPPKLWSSSSWSESPSIKIILTTCSTLTVDLLDAGQSPPHQTNHHLSLFRGFSLFVVRCCLKIVVSATLLFLKVFEA